MAKGRRRLQPVPSGAGEWEGADGGLQSDVSHSPCLWHRGARERRVEVTIFSFENQSHYSRGVELAMPTVPGHQGPSRWAAGRVSPPRLSPHTGRAAAACSGSGVPGGRWGQGVCRGSRTLLLAASRPGGRKRRVKMGD